MSNNMRRIYVIASCIGASLGLVVVVLFSLWDIFWFQYWMWDERGLSLPSVTPHIRVTVNSLYDKACYLAIANVFCDCGIECIVCGVIAGIATAYTWEEFLWPWIKR